MSDKIEIGDIVNVYFSTADAIFNVEIISSPCATGDCWRLKGGDGKLYNVQTYAYMEKVKGTQSASFRYDR